MVLAVDFWPTCIEVFGPPRFYSAQRFEHQHAILRLLTENSNGLNRQADVVKVSERVNDKLPEMFPPPAKKRLEPNCLQSLHTSDPAIEAQIERHYHHPFTKWVEGGSIANLEHFPPEHRISAFAKLPPLKRMKKLSEVLVGSEENNTYLVNRIVRAAYEGSDHLYLVVTRLEQEDPKEGQVTNHWTLKKDFKESTVWPIGKVNFLVRGLLCYSDVEAHWIGIPDLVKRQD